MRLIGAIRLSREDEASGLSPGAQREAIQRYAQRNGHTVPIWTEDLGVSGEKPIKQRPDVGKWLTEDHLDDWDGIIGSESARLFRDLADSVTFWLEFVQGHGKKVLTADGEIDMSTPKGQEDAFQQFLANQRELRKIKERNKRSAAYYRTQGLWHGGRIPFGYRPKRHGEHWILVPDENEAETGHADIAREVAQQVIAGKSLNAIARDLTARRVPTRWTRKPGNTNWRAGPLARLLRSKAMLGYVPYNFRKVNGKETYDLARGEDGSLLRREPILEEQTFADLQAALARPEQKSGRRSDASLLLNVGFCICGAKLWSNSFTSRGTDYAYYLCSAVSLGECSECSIDRKKLEAWVSDRMSEDDAPVWERRIERGRNHEAELEAVQEEQANLLAIQDEVDEEEFDQRMAELRAERKRLRSLPSEPDKVFWVQTGETYAQRWQTLTTDAERRAQMLSLGIKVYGGKDADTWRIEKPEPIVYGEGYTADIEAVTGL